MSPKGKQLESGDAVEVAEDVEVVSQDEDAGAKAAADADDEGRCPMCTADIVKGSCVNCGHQPK